MPPAYSITTHLALRIARTRTSHSLGLRMFNMFARDKLSSIGR